ncbi:MAG TPA: GNAT family N-acetyltransferase [Kineosporiaceae bacterium]
METGDLLAPGAAQASVRLARPGDAAAIGAVQLRCWRREYADVLPAEVLDRLPVEEFAARWHAAVVTPGSTRHAVLVACAGSAVVGFAALAPSPDADATPADAELVALEVDPAHQRGGHGSRLLAAAADAADERGFTALRVWVRRGDDARLAFLTSAGPRPDGALRRLRPTSPGSPGGPVAELVEDRLVAGLRPHSADG